MSINSDEMIRINRVCWDRVADRFYGKTALPSYGPLAQKETELHLLGDVRGKQVLEVGCGSGHSLLYLAQQGAGDLWGLDLSRRQIEFARKLFRDSGIEAHLFESPMETDPGLPAESFDLVFSIYALGWSAALEQTLARIAGYLKPGGVFVFSWEHPVYHCLEYIDGCYVFGQSYQQEGPMYLDNWQGEPAVQYPRQMSTYINGLIAAGLVIEQVIESAVEMAAVQERHRAPGAWYSLPRAQLVPTTMIIKARKPA